MPVNLSNRRRGAFTLFELVTVMAILAILASVSVGVFVKRRAGAKEDRAIADLQVIQIGLEAYRSRFGDYPQIPTTYPDGIDPVDTPEEYLLNALNGQIGPAHDKVTGINSMLNNSLLQFENAGLPLSDLQSNWIVDPWGEEYRYDYRPADSTWLQFGYELSSAGPDGQFGTADDIEAQ